MLAVMKVTVITPAGKVIRPDLCSLAGRSRAQHHLTASSSLARRKSQSVAV